MEITFILSLEWDESVWMENQMNRMNWLPIWRWPTILRWPQMLAHHAKYYLMLSYSIVTAVMLQFVWMSNEFGVHREIALDSFKFGDLIHCWWPHGLRLYNTKFRIEWKRTSARNCKHKTDRYLCICKTFIKTHRKRVRIVSQEKWNGKYLLFITDDSYFMLVDNDDLI